MALSDAERARRYRLRRRGVNVPKLPAGRRANDSYFRAESSEEFLGPLLNIDPQRLRDLESSVTSRGMSLADYVQMKRVQLRYGQQPALDESVAPAPHDPIVQKLLDFDFGDAE